MIPFSEDEVRALAEAGAAAPSGGNMQAWRLVVAPSRETMDLYLDEERSESFIDVDRMGSMLGLGSFTESVALAAAGRGIGLGVEVLGLTSVDRPVVRFTSGARDLRVEPSALRDAIFERATNRRAWDGTTIEDEAVLALGAAAREVGAGLDVSLVSGSDKIPLARALAEADVVRTFNRAYHQQMLSEMRWTPQEAESTRDGVDVATLELSSGDRKGFSMMRQRWFVALLVTRNRIRKMTVAGLTGSSHIGGLLMPREPSSKNLVAAGRALQRMWLAASAEGLALQPWSVIPFFELRAELHPDTLPQKDRDACLTIGADVRRRLEVPDAQRCIFVFRLFRAAPPSVRAYRRPVDDFIRYDEGRAEP